jgi:hypothetical protein
MRFHILAIAFLLASGFSFSDETAADPPYFNDPRLQTKNLKPLTEAELKDARQLVDKIAKLPADAPARKKVADLGGLHQHLKNGLDDPLYPAKIRAAIAVAEDEFDRMYKKPGPKARIGELREHDRFRKAITSVVAGVILQKKFGITWVRSGFPVWWESPLYPNGIRAALPGID